MFAVVGPQAVIAISMVWFRTLHWWYIFYQASVAAWVYSWPVQIFFVLAMLLFTAFNFDFVNFHVKVTKALWTRWQHGTKSKST